MAEQHRRPLRAAVIGSGFGGLAAAIRLAVAIVFGSMIASTLFGAVRQDFAQLSDDAVADELARNFLGYLSLDEAFGRT